MRSSSSLKGWIGVLPALDMRKTCSKHEGHGAAKALDMALLIFDRDSQQIHIHL